MPGLTARLVQLSSAIPAPAARSSTTEIRRSTFSVRQAHFASTPAVPHLRHWCDSANRNMQAIVGGVEFRSNAAARRAHDPNPEQLGRHGPPPNPSTNTEEQHAYNRPSAALIELVGERFTPTLTGGSGGSPGSLSDSPIFSQTLGN